MKILGYSEFGNIIANKNIVYVPIISCINRQTGEYDLSCDGNVNRFITTFSKCDTYKTLSIILPSVHVKGSEKILNRFKSLHNNIEFHYLESFGIHAGEQRNMDSVVNSVYDYISKIDCDMYIFESQKLGKKLIDNISNKEYIYYNPVSKVTGKTRVFLEGYDEINDWLFRNSSYMIVSSPDQIKFFDNGVKDEIIYLDKLIDRDIELFDYVPDIEIINELNSINGPIFYLPFRLTDAGYNIKVVIRTLLANYNVNMVIYYSDPNNSGYINDIDMPDCLRDKFKKISTDRNTYYTMIDHKDVIIPYYEDLDFINHAAIHEFMNNKSKCEVWVLPNNNPYNIMSCPRIKVNFKKPRLIVIEGQDQTGKDTLLDNVCSEYKDIYWYKQQTHEDTGTDYRKKNDYEAWLKDYINNQLDELIEIGKEHDDIIMTRLLVSDNVYSDLFGRNHIVESYFKDKIYSNFELYTCCLLWNTYDDYRKRIAEYTEEVEYEEDEFIKTKDLYKKYVKEDDIIYIYNEITRNQVIKMFYEWMYENIKREI